MNYNGKWLVELGCHSVYCCASRRVVFSDTVSVFSAKTAVQSFMSTCLDYCNSLMHVIADRLMQQLQAVQNADTRLITGAQRRDHISPVLRQLHWLPVCQRVQFKLAVLVFKALHGQAPQCLTDDCQLVAAAGRRQLRSSDVITCVVPRTCMCLGDRAFAVAGPRL